MPKVTLHRCPFTFIHNDMDSCWKVQKALDDQGVEYEVAKEWRFPRSLREKIVRLSGQDRLPVIEFEDGTAYRAESAEMAERIKAGKLFEQSG